MGAGRRHWFRLRGAAAWSGVLALALSSVRVESPAVAQAPTSPPAAGPEQQPSRQPDISDLSLEELSRVPVRTPRDERPAANPTGPGTVLDTSAADAVAPSSVGGLLEQAPGVSVRRTSALNLDPRVRGFHSGQLNANASGITQLKTRIDIDSLFSQIDPGNVQGLAVLDGPYTSLYGPGFAFLIADLYAAERFADGPQLHGSLTFSHGSNGRQIYNRERLWGGGPDWGFNVSYGLRTGNDYGSGHNSLDFRIPASYHQQDVFTAFSFDLTPRTRVEFNYIYLDMADVELPGVAYDIDRSETSQFNVRLVMQEDPAGLENFVVQYWEQRTPYTGSARRESKQITFSRFFIVQPFGDSYPAVATGNLNTNLLGLGLSESSGVRSLLTLGDKDALRWTIGADWRRYEQFYQERDFDGAGAPAFDGEVFGIPRSSQQDFGLFTHLGIPRGDKVTVTVGGRLDFSSVSMNENDIVVQNTSQLPLGRFSPGFTEPNELLGMAYATAEYRPATWLRLNSGIAFAMRNPNLAELYSAEPFVPVVRFGNSYTDGNSDLDPEKNLEFDLGVAGKWDDLKLGARLFHSTIYDYILPVASNFSTLVPAGVAAPATLHRNYTNFVDNLADPAFNPRADTASLNYKYANIDRATLYGGDLFGEVRLLPWLAINGTLAYVQGTNDAPVRFDINTGTLIPLGHSEPLPGIYPLNATLGVRLFEPRNNRWTLEFLTRMVHAQHRVADSLAELGTPGFTVFGIHGSYKLGEHARLFSSFENILDRTYSEHGSLAIVERNGTIGFVKEPGFSCLVGIETRF